LNSRINIVVIIKKKVIKNCLLWWLLKLKCRTAR